MCVTVIGVTGRLAVLERCDRHDRDDLAPAPAHPPDSVIVLAGVPLPFGMVAAVPGSACVLGRPAPPRRRAGQRWRFALAIRGATRERVLGAGA